MGANQMELTLRSKSTPHLHLDDKLKKSRAGAGMVLENRVKQLTEAKTLEKRHKHLHNWVFQNEEEHAGKQAKDAAKLSAKSAEPVKRPYPSYDELFNVRY